MFGKHQDLVGVAPFVVVPGEKFDKVFVNHDAGAGVEVAGVGVAEKIERDNLLVIVGNDIPSWLSQRHV